MRIWVVVSILLLIAAVVVGLQPHSVLAAGEAGNYLNYQEPKVSESSWLSTIGYLISLLITFALVIGLAYFASRFIGQKLGRPLVEGDNKVIATLPLGPNRGVFVVEIAGKIMILGVTDHNITLLQEVSDPEQKARLINTPANMPLNQFDMVLQRQLSSLQQMSHKFPGVFGSFRRNFSENEGEKR